MVLGSQTALASSVQFINKSFRGSGFVCLLVFWWSGSNSLLGQKSLLTLTVTSEDSSMLPKIIIVTGIPLKLHLWDPCISILTLLKMNIQTTLNNNIGECSPILNIISHFAKKLVCARHINVNVNANLRGWLCTNLTFKREARADNVNGGKRCFPATTSVWTLWQAHLTQADSPVNSPRMAGLIDS